MKKARVAEVKTWLLKHLPPKGDESRADYLKRVSSAFGSKFTSTAEKAANELWDEEQNWKGQLKELAKSRTKREVAAKLGISRRTLNRWLATAEASGLKEKRTPSRANRVKIADEAADLNLSLRG